MKVLTCILSFLNLYIGGNNFLNAIHVLHTSKYSQTATVVYAILFLGMAAAGLYFAFIKHNLKLALIIEIGPWILAIIFLLINMLTADYK